MKLWRSRLFWDSVIFAIILLVVAGVMAYMAQPVILAPRKNPAPQVDPLALEKHVRYLAEECRPRDFSHMENTNKAADYIEARLRETGGRIHEQAYEWSRRTYLIVLADYGPLEGGLTVVGAHYDAEGLNPAADDNASGVAGLIELGRLIGRNQPRGRVELAAYPNEEMFGTPAMGSRHHADALKSEGANVKLMVSLEMIGDFSDAPNSQRYPLPFLSLFYPSRGDFVAVVGRSEEHGAIGAFKRAMMAGGDIPVRSISAPFKVPGLDLSDHSSFWRDDYPAIMVTDTAFLRNQRYHSASDTPDTLNYGRMAQVVRGVYNAVEECASGK